MFADAFVADLVRVGAPEEPDPEILKGLVERYKWDPSIRDQIIIQLTLPVYYIAKKFQSRNNADDILSEAILALVECVERWPGVAEDDDIRRYVEFSVRKRMKDFIDNDSVICIPSRRVREKLAKGEEISGRTPFRIGGNYNPNYTGTDLDRVDREVEDKDRAVPEVAPDNTFDIQDFFRSRADARDQIIVEMRINGRPIPEICEAVGQKQSWVYRRLRDLEQAFAQIGEEAA
jgi:DNA-directed RNA polymerase specialized sigma24 family protein